MGNVIQELEQSYKKKAVVDVRSGDTVKVRQKIKEAGKERIQVFEGLVIKVMRPNSLTSAFTVRRIASGVGVEKTFMVHSPSILKVEVVKRSKVRRNYLSYMRELTGKSTRLAGLEFDREAVNIVEDETAEAEAEKLKEEAEKQHAAQEVEKAEQKAKEDAKAEAALAKHEAAQATAESPKSEAEELEERPKEKAAAETPAAAQNKQR